MAEIRVDTHQDLLDNELRNAVIGIVTASSLTGISTATGKIVTHDYPDPARLAWYNGTEWRYLDDQVVVGSSLTADRLLISTTSGWTTSILGINSSGSLVLGVGSASPHYIENVATPITDYQAANRLFVLNTLSGASDIHAAAKLKSIANLSSLTFPTADTGNYFDADYTLLNGDRVLLTDQISLPTNGIYTVGIGSVNTTLTRATDADETGELKNGSSILVTQGTVWGSTSWAIADCDTTITIGTSDIKWVQTAASREYTAGAGLTLTGSVFDIGTGDTQAIVVGANSINLYDNLTTARTNKTKFSVNKYGVITSVDEITSANGIVLRTAADTYSALTGTANYVPKWSGTSLSSTSLIYDTGTAVGIGTTTPATLLHVNGALTVGVLSGVLKATTGLVSGLAGINDLSDVAAGTATTGQLLGYNTATSKWINVTRTVNTTTPLSGGGALTGDITLTLGGLTGIGTTNYVLGVNAAGAAWEYKAIQATALQTTVSHSANAVTIGTVQGIGTVSTPTFADLYLTGMTGQIITSTSVKTAIQDLDDSAYKTTQTGFDSWSGSGNYYSVTGAVGSQMFNLLRGGYAYVKGKKVTFSGGQSISVGTSNQAYYIWVSSAGAIGTTTYTNLNETSYLDNAMLFEALNDGTNVLVVKENHPYSMNTAASVYIHHNIGIVIRGSGAVITQVTTGTGTTVTDRKVRIAGNDYLEDHGIVTNISNTVAGVTWNFYYQDNYGKWLRHSQSDEFPIVYLDTDASAGGTITTVANSKFSIICLYVSKDDLNSSSPTYYAVINRATEPYSNSSDALNAITAGNFSIASNELASLELAQLGYAVIAGNTGAGYIFRVIPAKSTINARFIGGSSTGIHGLLSGLTADDHTQYALLAGRISGQTLYGGTTTGETLKLFGTASGTGNVFINSSGGNVGIGTTVASTTLHVGGSLTLGTLSGVLKATAGLVSNSAGIDDLNDVTITSAATGQLLGYSTVTGQWSNITRTINTTGPLAGGGALTSDLTLSMPGAGTSTSGYLTSTDWNTFNNKANASTTISVTSPLSGGGDLSANRSIALAGLSSLGPANYLVGVNSGANAWEYKSISGTSNQISVTHTANAITLSTPQSIGTGNTVTFAGLTLTGLSGVLKASAGVISGSASINDLSNVAAGTATTGQLLGYNTATSKWENVTRTINTSAPLGGGGALTGDLTLTITAAGTASTGYLTSTDWNTFNNKVSTSRSISTTSPLTGGGSLSGDLTLGVGGLTSLGTANYVIGVNTAGTAWEYKSIAGTANQVNVTTAAGLITLSTPQAIGSTSSPTFSGITLSGLGAGVVKSNSSGVLTNISTGSTGTILRSTGPEPAWTTLTLPDTIAAGSVLVANSVNTLTSLTSTSSTTVLQNNAGTITWGTLSGISGVTGAGVTNQVAKWQTASALTTSIIYDTGSAVGIGTTSPVNKLTTYGAITMVSAYDGGALVDYSLRLDQGNGNDPRILTVGSATTAGTLKISQVTSSNTDYRDVIYIANGGQVGIGTNIVSNGLLNVYGNTYTGTLGFNTTYTVNSPVTGTTYWDNSNHTISTALLNGVVLQHGQELHVYVKNNSNVDILNGDPVSIDSQGGSSEIWVKPTDITSLTSAKGFLGLATQDIAKNARGYITTFGLVRDLATSSFTEGIPVYVGMPTTGTTKLTHTVPSHPYSVIDVGIVVYAQNNNGIIFVNPHLQPAFVDLSDVDGTALTADGQFAVWLNTPQYFDFVGKISGTANKIAKFTDTYKLADSVISEVSGNIGINTATPAAMLHVAGTTKIDSNLTIGTLTGFLYATAGGVGTTNVWNGTAPTPAVHNLLDSITHGDTLTTAVARGSIVVGNSTPKWTALGIGTTAGYVLKTSGTEPYWATITKSDIGLGSVENTALSTWAGSSNVTIVGVVTSGTWNGAVVGISYGGTGATTKTLAFNALSPLTTLGDIVYHDGTNSVRLAGNITTTKQVLAQTGIGSISAAPQWTTLTKSDVGLSNVENTALSTWAGSSNITTVGMISSGTWTASVIDVVHGGTGLNTVAAGSILAANTANTLSAITSASGTKVLKNIDGVVSWDTVAGISGITGTGTTGKIPKWSSASALTDSVITESSSNIGIGSTLPQAKLDIAGSILVGTTRRFSYDGSTGSVYIRGDSGGYANAYSFLNNSGSNLGGFGVFGGADDLAYYYVGTYGAEKLIINTTGDAGFGITPTNYGHGGNNKHLQVYNPNTVQNSQSHLWLLSGSTVASSSVGTISWALPNATSTQKNIGLIAGVTGSGSTAGTPSMYMSFYTRNTTDINWAERMRISELGYVGIGTGTPAYKLEVNSGATQGIAKFDNDYGTVLLVADSNANYIESANTTFSAVKNLRITGYLAQSPALTQIDGTNIYLNGSVGINTADPGTYKLNVNGTANFSDEVTIATLNAPKLKRYIAGALTAGNWYRIAYQGRLVYNSPAGGTRASAKITLYDVVSSYHSTTSFWVSYHFGLQPTIILLGRSSYGSGGIFSKIRLITGSTYDGCALEVYCANNATANYCYYTIENNDQINGFTTALFTAGSIPANFTANVLDFSTDNPIYAATTEAASNAIFINRSGVIQAPSLTFTAGGQIGGTASGPAIYSQDNTLAGRFYNGANYLNGSLTVRNDADNATNLLVENTGNVGIGTIYPQSKLHVNNSSTTGTVLITGVGESTSTIGALNFRHITYNTATVASVECRRTVDDAVGQLVFTTAPGSASPAVDRMIITADGKIGIGTVIPTANLHVYSGSNYGSPSLSADTYNLFKIGTALSPELAFGSYSASPYAMWLQTKTTANNGTYWPLAINPLGGNVGIGTSAPSALLHVNGNTYVSGTLTLSNLTGHLYATNGSVGVTSVWTGNAPTPAAHNILDSTVHGDTLTTAVARGSIIIGNSTPKWTALGIGTTAGYVLKTSGTDPYWALLDTNHHSLQGLGDDDHTQYALLAGRTGGQTLYGGTAAADKLILHGSTAGTGAIYINPGNAGVVIGGTGSDSTVARLYVVADSKSALRTDASYTAALGETVTTTCTAFANYQDIVNSGTMTNYVYNNYSSLTLGGTGSFANAVNIFAYTKLTGGTAKTVTALTQYLSRIYADATPNAGTITSAYHFKADDATDNLTITTQYGLYISALTKASTNWAIYTAGTTPSYFGGAVTIGGAISSGSLSVGSLTGVLKASAGTVTAGSVALGSEVTGTLPITNGGTGLATVAIGSILAANSADALSAVTSASGTKILKNVNGAISWDTVSGISGVSGTGTTGYMARWTNSTTIAASSVLYDDGTNVGIGTTSPVETLTIYKPAGSNSSLSLGDGDVAHGVTSLAKTNVWLLANEHTTDKGGAQLTGFSDAPDNPAFEIKGVNTTDPDTNIPAITLDGYSANGTGVKALAATKTVLQIQNSGSALMSILGNGNVGVGITNPETSLVVAGPTVYSNPTFTHYQNLAYYSYSGAPTETGTKIITLPQGWTSTMMSITVKGYDYSGNGGWEAIVSGYNYAPSPTWINTSAEIRGKAPFTSVRLGYNTTSSKMVLMLGTSTTVWNYPKLSVSDFYAGHSNVTGWGTGWSIINDPTETGIGSAYTVNVTAPIWIDSNGAVGIGTSIPTSHAPNRKSVIISDTANDALLEIWGQSGQKSIVQSAGGNTYMGVLAGPGNLNLTYGPSGNVGLIMQNTTGNIGINTTDFTGYRLNVNGNTNITGTLTASSLLSASAQIVYPYAKTDTTLRTGISIYSNDSTNQFNVAIAMLGGASQSARTAVIQTSEAGVSNTGNIALQVYGGNVGIGTAAPTAKLTIVGNSLTGAEATYGGYIKIIGGGGALTSTGGIEFCAATSGAGYGFRIANPDLGTGECPLYIMSRCVSASWTLAMSILGSNGFVGIGSATPTQKLDVAGNIVASGSVGATTVYPIADNSYTSGSSYARWSTVYGVNADFSGSLTVKGLYNTSDYTERVFQSAAAFVNGEADKAVDIRLSNSIWGWIELEVTGSYYIDNTTGKLTKIFAFGGNDGALYLQNTRVSDAMGYISSHITIGDIVWDGAVSKWKITVYHTSTYGNTYTFKLRSFSHGGAASLLSGAAVSAIYTAASPLTRQYTYYNDRLGVGTSTPAEVLDVNGNIALPGATNYLTFGGGAGGSRRLKLYETSVIHAGLGIDLAGGPYELSIYGMAGDAGQGRISFGFAANANPGTYSEKVSFLNSGNVGIGITNPTGKLQVSMPGMAASLTYTQPGLLQLTDTTGPTELVFTVDGVGPYAAALQHRHATLSGYSYPITINPLGGNVGIGTIAPSELLHVNGNILATRINFSAGGAIAGTANGPAIYSQDGSLAGRFYNGNNYLNGALVIRSDADVQNMIVTDTGYVGIGTASPTTKLESSAVYGDPATSGSSPNGMLALTTASAYRGIYLGISSNATANYPGWLQVSDWNDLSQTRNFILNPRGGYVGIGTVDPTAKLHVYGGGVNVGGSVTSTGASINGLTVSQIVRPASDNTYTLGTIGYRWSTIYGVDCALSDELSVQGRIWGTDCTFSGTVTSANLIGVANENVDSSSYCLGDISSTEWTYEYKALGYGADVQSNYTVDPTYGKVNWLNYNGAAGNYGVLSYRICTPAAVSSITFSVPAKLALGVSTAIAVAIYNSAANTVLASTAYTLTSNWQNCTVTYNSPSANTEYIVVINCNNVSGASVQAQALVGKATCTMAGTNNGITESSYTRLTVTNDALEDDLWNIQSTRVNIASPFSRYVIDTDATTLMVEMVSTMRAAISSLAHIAYKVNGEAAGVIAATTNGLVEQHVITLPAGHKRVEFINGPTSKPSATILGTWLRAIFVPGTARVATVKSKVNDCRIAIYGDSICVGNSDTSAALQAWPVQLRERNVGSVAVDAYGWRNLWDDKNDSAGWYVPLARSINRFKPTHIWLAIGTNDYGLYKQNAASFRKTYDALLDLLHAQNPQAKIFCQSPITRTDSPSPTYEVIANYRTAVSASATARPDFAHFVDGTAIIASGDLADGVHPTTAGDYKFAQYVENFIRTYRDNNTFNTVQTLSALIPTQVGQTIYGAPSQTADLFQVGNNASDSTLSIYSVFDSAGKLGVGCNTPKQKLQIGNNWTGSYDSSRSVLVNPAGTQNVIPSVNISDIASTNTTAYIKAIGLNIHNDDITTTGTRVPALAFSRRANATYTDVLGAIDAIDIGSGQDANWRAGALTFHTAEEAGTGIIERMRINGTGLGIGTTTPGAKLDVVGSIQATGIVHAGSTSGFANSTYAVNSRNPIWRFANASTYGLSYFQGSAGLDGANDTIGIHFGTATAAGSQYQFNLSGAFTLGGKIGIGVTNPSSKLSFGNASASALQRIALYETSTSTYFYGIGMANPATDIYGLGLWSSTDTAVVSDTNMQVFIKNNGNIGIGTYSADAKLHIRGTASTNAFKFDTLATATGTKTLQGYITVSLVGSGNSNLANGTYYIPLYQ
jgi:hypothetical protein